MIGDAYKLGVNTRTTLLSSNLVLLKNNLMSNPKTEPKPIIGDDGELLEADQNVDMRSYNAYVEFLRRIAARQPDQNPVNLFFMVVPGLALAVLIFLMMSSLAQQRDQARATPTVDHSVLSTPQATIRVQSGQAGAPYEVDDIYWTGQNHDLMVNLVHHTRYIWDVDANKMRMLLSGEQEDRIIFDRSADGQFSVCLTKSLTILYKCDRQNKTVSALVLEFSLYPEPTIIRWSPDGTRLAILYDDNHLSIMTLDGASISASIPVPPSLTDVQWMPDSQQLIGVADDQIWRFQNGQSWMGLPFPNQKIRGLKLSADGKRLALDLQQGNLETLLVMENGKTRWQASIGHGDIQYPLHMTWSPDSRHLSTFSDKFDAKEITVWNPADGTITNRIELDHIAKSQAWSSDSRYLAVGNFDGVSIWSP